MRHAAPLIVLFLLGCESDAEKLNRLQEDAGRAQILASYHQRMMDSIQDAVRGGAVPVPGSYDAHADSLKLWTDRATLAERELNIFMQGR